METFPSTVFATFGAEGRKKSDVSSSAELLGNRGDSANKLNSCLGFDHAAMNFVPMCVAMSCSVSVIMTTCPSGGNCIR